MWEVAAYNFSMEDCNPPSCSLAKVSCSNSKLFFLNFSLKKFPWSKLLLPNVTPSTPIQESFASLNAF